VKRRQIRSYLPCAGITLIRFYGYFLSNSANGGKAPRETENLYFFKEQAKIRHYYF
jgi:hypothetical protein